MKIKQLSLDTLSKEIGSHQVTRLEAPSLAFINEQLTSYLKAGVHVEVFNAEMIGNVIYDTKIKTQSSGFNIIVKLYYSNNPPQFIHFFNSYDIHNPAEKLVKVRYYAACLYLGFEDDSILSFMLNDILGYSVYFANNNLHVTLKLKKSAENNYKYARYLADDVCNKFTVKGYPAFKLFGYLQKQLKLYDPIDFDMHVNKFIVYSRTLQSNNQSFLRTYNISNVKVENDHIFCGNDFVLKMSPKQKNRVNSILKVRNDKVQESIKTLKALGYKIIK